MMKIFSFIKKNLLIIIILLTAIFFRFTSINPGYPAHTDEAGYSSAITMIWNENLDPARYDYPSGVPLIHFFAFKLIFIPISWTNYFFNNIGQILDGLIKLPFSHIEYKRIFNSEILGNREINVMYWGRYITAVFGVGVVFMTYLLSNKVFNKTVGIIASFLVAVNFRQVLNSHIGLPDIYNAFFLLLALYFSYSITLEPKKKNYFLAGLFNALCFSIKFQTFGFLPLLVSHILVFKKSNILNLVLSLFTSAFFIILLNPYLLIKFELFRSIQIYTLAKYGMGSNSINIFPITYLYHIGVGEIILILFALGFIYGLVKHFKKSVLLALVVIQFTAVFVYLSRGGFYTRNFVTITPILLIFSSVFISDLFSTIKVKWASTAITVIFVVVISFGNIKNSLVVIKEYGEVWNRSIFNEWATKNIPVGSKVSAHSDTPLADNVVRLSYEPDIFFSVDEFKAQKADYAISNSSWSTNSFYWWMGGPTKEAIRHLWEKPIDVLEYSYPALALRELEQFNVYNISNPWQAPDTDFLVAKLPEYKVLNKTLVKTFNFNNDIGDWKKAGLFWAESDNLAEENGSLVIREEPLKLPSIRWESPVIDINNWNGFVVNYNIMTESDTKDLRTGYIFVSFYESIRDAEDSKNRIGLRLSERNNLNGKWINKDLVGTISETAKYMTIGFSNYSPAKSKVLLDNLRIYNASVEANFNGVSIYPAHVDQNNLFLNSHGNL